MTISDEILALKAYLQPGANSKYGLKQLEQLRRSAKKSRDTDGLRSVHTLAHEAEASLGGRDAKEAHRIAYAADMNLRELAYAGRVLTEPTSSVSVVPADAPPESTIATADTPRPRMQVRGHNGTVTLDDTFVTISRRGFLARTSVGKGDKRILIRTLSAVQIKPAGPVMNGFIQFTVGGGIERRSHFGSQTRSAVRDENSVIFHWMQRHEFAALKEAVERAMAEVHTPKEVPATQAPGIPEQIRALSELRDSGILTPEEFDAKKQELLSRM